MGRTSLVAPEGAARTTFPAACRSCTSTAAAADLSIMAAQPLLCERRGRIAARRARRRQWAHRGGGCAPLEGRAPIMRAVVYKKPFDVAVEEVPDPRIEHPDDVIVRVTSTAICGSDLHMYEGRTAARPGLVFGHENLGTVEEVGVGRDLARGRRPRRHAVQRGLRVLQELRGRLHRLLPDREPRLRRRRLRICRHGPVPRRAGRAPARALRRLQLPQAPARRRARCRLRAARRHLPHRLPRL